MNIFDKIASKMIITNDKLDTDSINLEKFYLKENSKIAKKMSKRVYGDMDTFKKCDFYKQNLDHIAATSDELVENMFAFTKNKMFSDAFSFLNECATLYALYYLNTDKSREPKQISITSDRLVDVYELITYISLKYFNYDRKETLIFKEGKFYSKPSEESDAIIMAISNKLKAISSLVTHIRNQNNNGVHNCYLTLKDTNITQFLPSPFSEFE